MAYIFDSNAAPSAGLLIQLEPEEENFTLDIVSGSYGAAILHGHIGPHMLATPFVGQTPVLDVSDTDDSQVTQINAEKFERLARSWRESMGPTSSIHKMSMHSSYQQIIAMGNPAVLLILEELQREPDHWFWALRVITGADPVQSENKGNVREMANDWLTWGHDHGFI